MAKRVITTLEDDLDGTEASETVNFAIDGAEYEIDLNEAHANELREVLSKYAAVAQKTGGRGRPPARRTKSGGNDTKAIRAWAIEKGIPINARGRIQADVMEKYAAAH
ncbi:histone-like nucleoid-structuring protein Lsr2 [Arthrobacter oryzae]|uniref:histone-like nucleoid-structuring protein Lsr2 n=1 Tax=Arthrobacter oryzae TaxID=409290 RepID=UPI002781CCA8|nr:Lsr2 family protein [Arthrobacter oryzae]MDQ0078238.1 hypothetical protein [Arthrobacter oryzae]